MILGVKKPVSLWEAVAVLQIQQATEWQLSSLHLPQDLLTAAQLPLDVLEPDRLLDLDGAYRAVDSSPMPYAQIVAGLNGIDPNLITNPMLPGTTPSDIGGIVLCPFGLKPEVDLPINVWADIVRLLRSYGVPVQLVGDPNQRLDSAYFSEDATLSNLPLSEKLKVLASAKLVVGMPNGYTWLCTGWNKRQIIYYPSAMPNSRWMGFLGHGHSYILAGYDSHSIQVPLLVTGMRLAIEGL